MKNTWLISLFIVGLIVAGVVIFNYQSEDGNPYAQFSFNNNEVEYEYEYMDDNNYQAEMNENLAELEEAVEEVERELPPMIAEVEPEAIVPDTLLTESETIESVAAVQSPPPPAPTPSNAVPLLTKLGDIDYTIQMASFKTKNQAESFAKKIGASDVDPFIVRRNLGSKGTWYRVYVGKFSTKNDAQNLLAKVQRTYPDSFIISPRKR